MQIDHHFSLHIRVLELANELICRKIMDEMSSFSVSISLIFLIGPYIQASTCTGSLAQLADSFSRKFHWYLIEKCH